MSNINKLWRFSGETEWKYPGIVYLPAGTYTVEFKDVLGHVTPASQTITVTSSTGSLSVTGTYTDAGILKVTITGASGAQWSADGGTTWNASGASITKSAGTYTITFSAVSGYTTPSSQTVTVTNGSTTTVTQAYVAQSGTLTVNITGASSGRWSVDGGTTWNNSGASATLTAGAYTVTFSAVSGYTTPASQTATITAGQTTTLTATYESSSSGGGSSSGISDGYVGNLTATYYSSYAYDQSTGDWGYTGAWAFTIEDSSATGTSRVWHTNDTGEGGDWLGYNTDNSQWEVYHDAMGCSDWNEVLSTFGGPDSATAYCSTLDGTFTNGGSTSFTFSTAS